jgi:hypothetical protein
MSKTLLQIDSAFVDHYKDLISIQKQVVNDLKGYVYDLDKREITEAIMARMGAFWGFHIENNKRLLNRTINTAADDFFTETCLLFIKCFFRDKYDVCSEKSICTDGKKNIRPDVSIWDNDTLVAAIELKVSNGWKGKSIMDHLRHRESQILECWPSAYFGVLSYWNFFDKNSTDWGKKYFAIADYDEKNNHPITSVSVENLLSQIKQISVPVHSAPPIPEQ